MTTAADAARAVRPDEPHRSGLRGARPQPGTGARSRFGLAVLVVGVFAVYTTYALVRHATFRTTGYDLGIFDQAVRDYAHLRAPVVPLKAPGYNLLGDHFHPLIAVLAPLYWIWDDPRMLLIAQAGLFAVSIIPVFRFAARRFGSRAAWWTGLIYGVSWPLQRAVQFDFHEIALAVPLIAVLIDALDRRRLRTVVVCGVLLLGVREDMGALVLLVGVLVALPGTGARMALPGTGARFDGSPEGRASTDGTTEPVAGRRLRVFTGIGLSVLGLGGYELVTRVLIPAMATDGAFAYWTFPALGPDLPSAVRFTLTHPWQVLVLLITPRIKADTLLAMVMPTAFLALGSRYLLLAVPFVAERMLNSRPQLWETGFHYTSVIAPILVMAAVDTVHRVAPLLGGSPALRKAAWWLPVRWRTGWWLPVRWRTGWRLGVRWLTGARPGLPGAGLVAAWLLWCLVAIGHGSVTGAVDYPMGQLWSGSLWAADDRVSAIRATLPLIPPRECVEADNQISPHLTSRDYVTQVTRSQGLATWVLVDVSQEETGWLTPHPVDAMVQTVADGFRVVAVRGPIVLLHRDGPVDPRCRVVP